MKLIEKTVSEFLQELGSSKAVPGGGSAAALAGALGAELFLMTCRLPKSRNNAPEERAALDRAAVRLGVLSASLRAAIDEDSASFDAVMEAMRLPKEGDEQKRARSQAIQAAYLKAAEVPLDVCGHIAEALSIGSDIVSAVNPNALSDAGTGAALLGAGLDGASMNVRINLGSIKDPDFVSRAAARLKAERARAGLARETIRAQLEREGLHNPE